MKHFILSILILLTSLFVTVALYADNVETAFDLEILDLYKNDRLKN